MLPVIPCPACYHEANMRARLNGLDVTHDETARMGWIRPGGGARGQVVTRWDGGYWGCLECGLHLVPRDAGVLLDAALTCVNPQQSDAIHPDVRRALHGGPR